MIRRIVKWLAIVAVLAYAAWVSLLYFMQWHVTYPGAGNHVGDHPPPAPGLEVIRLETPVGKIEALFLPARAAAAGRQPVMIFAHGNGEVTDFWTTAFEGFRERGIGVLLVEYPGYGRSTGRPSEDTIRTALAAGFDHIAADARVDPARIFGFGQSLGGAAICQLASVRPLRALILQSTFTSLDIFPARYGAPVIMLRNRYDSLAVVRAFQGPVLVIHGRNDRVIPWQEGERLAAAAQHSTFRIYDCAHLCWEPERVPFWKDAEPFLAAAGLLGED